MKKKGPGDIEESPDEGQAVARVLRRLRGSRTRQEVSAAAGLAARGKSRAALRELLELAYLDLDLAAIRRGGKGPAGLPRVEELATIMLQGGKP